jgi:transcriptional regulator with XRE-family HTH domain
MTKTIFVPAYRNLVVVELRRARRNAGLTQTDVGRRIGKSRQFVHLYESCQSRLDVAQLCAIARICGVRAHVLVRRLEQELSEEDASSYVSELADADPHGFLCIRRLWPPRFDRRGVRPIPVDGRVYVAMIVLGRLRRRHVLGRSFPGRLPVDSCLAQISIPTRNRGPTKAPIRVSPRISPVDFR